MRSGLNATKHVLAGEQAAVSLRSDEQVEGAADVGRRREHDQLPGNGVRDNVAARAGEHRQVGDKMRVDRRRHADDHAGGGGGEALRVGAQFEPLAAQRRCQPVAVGVEQIDPLVSDRAEPLVADVDADDATSCRVKGERRRQSDITEPDDSDVEGEGGVGDTIALDDSRSRNSLAAEAVGFMVLIDKRHCIVPTSYAQRALMANTDSVRHFGAAIPRNATRTMHIEKSVGALN